MIQHLVVDETQFKTVIPMVLPGTWLRIIHCTNGHPLLPSLRLLRWDVCTPYCLALLTLLSSTVTNLHLVFHQLPLPQHGPDLHHEWQHGCSSLLFDLHEAASSIKVLTVSLGNSFGVPSFTAISHFYNLRILDITCNNVFVQAPKTSGHALYYLGLLLHLESLSLECRFEPDTTTTLVIPAPSHPLFPSLRNLGLRDNPGNTYCYKMLSAAPLQDLQIVLEDYEDVPTCRSRLQTLVHTFARLQTIDLVITDLEAHIPNNDQPAELSAVLQPLYDLCTLQQVAITFPVPELTIGDPDLNLMGQSWPALTHLTIHTFEKPMTPSAEPPTLQCNTTITFDGVIALAWQCHHLLSLFLPALHIPANVPAGGMPLDRMGTHNLRYLNTELAVVHDPVLSAKWLGTLFPLLHSGMSIVEAKEMLAEHLPATLSVEKVTCDVWQTVLFELQAYRNSMRPSPS